MDLQKSDDSHLWIRCQIDAAWRSYCVNWLRIFFFAAS
jgi:hypothetical protein